MLKFAVEQWHVPSDSRPGVNYVVSLCPGEEHEPEGHYECSCVGWTRHFPRRDCKHIAVVKAGQGRSLDPLLTEIAKAQHRERRKAERAAAKG